MQRHSRLLLNLVWCFVCMVGPSPIRVGARTPRMRPKQPAKTGAQRFAREGWVWFGCVNDEIQ